jgi:hypothetical protein
VLDWMPTTARSRWLYSGLALADDVGLVTTAEVRAPSQPPPALLPAHEPAPLVPVSKPPRVPLLAAGKRAMLFGDALVGGLVTPLGHLVREAEATLFAQGRHGSQPEQWLLRGWFEDVLAQKADVLLAAFAWPAELSTTAMHRLEEIATDRMTRIVWVAPPGATPQRIVSVARELNELRQGRPYWPHRMFRSDGLTIPVGPDGRTPTARGYAGWAGALWAYLC